MGMFLERGRKTRALEETLTSAERPHSLHADVTLQHTQAEILGHVRQARHTHCRSTNCLTGFSSI